MKDITTLNEKQTFALGGKTAAGLRGGEVLALYGELGAGKTTFVQGLINYFLPGQRVLSPTFIIVRHYYPHDKYVKHLVHADLYRLENQTEIEDLGLSEFYNRPGFVVAIEWADRAKGLLPGQRTDIAFSVKNSDTRRIAFKKFDGSNH